MICSIIPGLCKVAGVPMLDDARIRATGIQMLTVLDLATVIRGGKSVTAAQVKGNVALKSEENADPTNSQTPNLIMERRRFRRRMQEPDESAAAYLKGLDAMSRSCGFSSQGHNSIAKNLA